MDLLRDKDVIQIVRNMLDLMDNRLVNHGERVTFLMTKLMEELGYSQDDIFLGAKLALFHDIGAYKTDEIDNLLSFESHDVWEHAIYGYLFLSRMSPLSQHADCILFHHLDYNKLLEIECSNKDLASLIHFCDRMDVLLQSHKNVDDYFKSQLKNGKFQQDHIDAFFRLNQDNRLLKRIFNGEYHQDMDELFSRYIFSQEEKHMYLCMLAYSIDFNSEFTVIHTIMTTSLAQEIAKFCDLSEHEIQKIYYGALLHDVGKASIPIKILEKPGKLTDEEMQIMQGHVLGSEKVLRGYVPDDILQIAIRHHEKLDGSGYPYGLAKDDLSLSECIVAVADILSALLGRRSYKDPLSVDKAMSIICEMAKDGLISQEVVDTFVEHQEEILMNTRQHSQELREIYESMQSDYVHIREEIGKYLL
ncbi:HD domain-containing phosphohydrolase [Longibaculum muris]|uniref:HD domain-containing phosphohydrolase n=1 Tax=Longibaculum muris TaxID=1796628 RepID=UPI0012BA270F|nr:HD domain-containing phosphohydrolase [Longibaculum muris]